MNPPESRVNRGHDEASPTEVSTDPERSASVASTVGTGSVLGIGCVVALVVFVIVAIAARWLMGGW